MSREMKCPRRNVYVTGVFLSGLHKVVWQRMVKECERRNVEETENLAMDMEFNVRYSYQRGVF